MRDVGKGVFCLLILWIKFVSDEDVKFIVLIFSYKINIMFVYGIYVYLVR